MEHAAHLLHGAPTFPEYVVPMSMHHENRQKLIARLRAIPAAAKSFAIFQGGQTLEQYDTDHEIVFRQESNFQYLFGIPEPDSLAGIDVATGKAYYFAPRRDSSWAVWCGQITPVAEYTKTYAVDESHYVDDVAGLLKKLGHTHVLALIFKTNWVTPLPTLDGVTIDTAIMKPELDECRVFKSEEEIKLMRHINAVSSWAHIEVMKQVRLGMGEHELNALFRYLTYKNGRCVHQSYECICAAGKNGATLHYPHSNKDVKDGAMLLLDMGAEYYCYTSDITNSFPANGRFTQDQRDIYNIVLSANRAVMAAMKPGVAWTDMHRLAERIVAEGLIKLDIIRGELSEVLKHHIQAIFFPHGLGHLLGLDTHDVGGYPNGMTRIAEPSIKYLRTRRVLQPGMVITVEPGVYFIDALLDEAFNNPETSKFLNKEKIERFRNFGGVRIEDDVLITATGIENFTKLPRTCEEIEAAMAHHHKK